MQLRMGNQKAQSFIITLLDQHDASQDVASQKQELSSDDAALLARYLEPQDG